MKLRTTEKAFSLEEKGYCGGWLRYVIPLADFALIRHWRATFPTRGKATAVIPLRLETASELRWNGRNVSAVRPPSSVASRKLLAVFLPHPGEGMENRYYGGSTRRFRPHPALACHLPHPGEGYCGGSARFRDSADFLVRLRNRTEQIRTAERSLPPGGEGVAPATDEGETGERST